jgi:hypothetical protein
MANVRGFTFIGIDGEGQGDKEHRYNLIGAATEGGERTWHIEAAEGERLTTIECLDFILSLPSKRTKLFAYSFNYDLTKILTDLPNEKLYKLFRPELRQRTGDAAKMGPKPIRWKGYSLNLQGTKFTLKRHGKRVVIWDIFKFYQAKFVNALTDWRVGNDALRERMRAMKDKRHEFDKEDRDAIRAYCLEECACLAELARKLVQSHEAAGLKLRSFYGAGSSGAAMLTAMGVKGKNIPTAPAMREAVAAAFFGGRFENSAIGSIKERVWNYDISSAYPYQTTFLPCLEHGSWRLTRKRADIDRARWALVHYRLHETGITSWGPFPFRDRDGNICFPSQSGGGWIWKAEYVAGEKLFPSVEFREAWIYECHCECRPFSKIPEYYAHRLRIGKEGPGIVIKLAVNSCYGKLAQSVGSALFNSWIWAGLITSGTRAQILDVLGKHQDWQNLLMIATDGIYTRERLAMPTPLDTDTALVVGNDGKEHRKPLGGWEEKEVPKGIFMARPGIYFPLDPTEAELKDVRGRGVGKGTVLHNWRKIVQAYERQGVKGSVEIANVSRFCGAKTSIHYSAGKGYTRANAKDGIKPAYGQWIGRRIEMTFDPMPKRECVNPDGLTLKLRSFGLDVESVPYDRAVRSKEAIELAMATQEILEQPDGDLAEYDLQAE